MISLTIASILTGYLLGMAVTLAVTYRRARRIEADTWQAARRFYRHQKLQP